MIHRAPFSRRRSLPAFAALAFCAAITGRATAQTPAANATGSKASGKEYVLAHPSGFAAPPASDRNPLWPIGWVPTAAVPTATTTAAPVLNVTADQFVVTSISVDTAGGLAVIDGKTRGVGDKLPVSADGKEFVTVKHIADGLVVLDYKGRELRCTPAGPGSVRRPATK